MGNFKVEMLALRRMETWWGCRYHFEERARWCNNVLCDNIPLGLKAVTLKMPLLNSLKCCLHSSYCSLIVAQTVTFYKRYNCETNFMLILWILPLYHNLRAENTFTNYHVFISLQTSSLKVGFVWPACSDMSWSVRSHWNDDSWWMNIKLLLVFGQKLFSAAINVSGSTTK